MSFRPEVKERIREVVARSADRSVAVFDFDNTCIRGDIGELFGCWLVDQMAYRYDLDAFWELIDPLDGRDEIRGIVHELQATEGSRDEALYQRYRAEMNAIYPRKLAREGKAAAYAWAVRLLVGLREGELDAMSRRCVRREWSRPLGEEVLETERGERMTIELGIAPFRAIRETMEVLREAGWEVWVVSATNVWTVRAAASLLFGVDPDRVIGNQVTVENGTLTDQLVPPALFREGKVGVIERDIGVRPRIVFGDSETDLSMLEWASDLAVVIDHGDEIAGEAAARLGWAVQPRDELETVSPDVEVVPADQEGIARGAEILRGGGLVAFPTETVYGLGANALQEESVRRIFAAKKRPTTNPIIVHVATVDAARELAAEWPEQAQKLADAFWPGPLTLVLPKTDAIPEAVTAGLDTFGVRIPESEVARDLITAAGFPIAAPSANRYTGVSPTAADHVVTSLGDAVQLVLDGGPTTVGIESTVVAITADGAVLLRPGEVSHTELEAVVGPVRRAIDTVSDEVARPSPGQSARHYSPRAKVMLEPWDQERHAGAAYIGFDLDAAPGASFAIQLPRYPGPYAQQLYAALWEVDAVGADRLVVEPPPADAEWEACRDRLKRASG